jgi:hypothetical protein
VGWQARMMNKTEVEAQLKWCELREAK